ncbi:Hypothetical protein FKW44_017063 [Caligus rogercresseyi]|uniref:Uncharacterized protein n=1 Tax=Caligus rogercresseyi TaxID=217165 RepID=A0A7T8H3F3_CALRO|nr:Hypothetical protein FKW44_017063 [Caligus rogercresseyi]
MPCPITPPTFPSRQKLRPKKKLSPEVLNNNSKNAQINGHRSQLSIRKRIRTPHGYPGDPLP